MALERDKVFQEVDTRFMRPVSTDNRAANQMALEASGNIAESGIAAVKQRTVQAAGEQSDATVRAYDNITRLNSDASNFDDVFANADDETVRAGRDMIAQLKRETGSIANAVAQGKLNSSVAQARLERIIADKAKVFPGWEDDIASAVSGHVGFDPRGFAARRILGIGAREDKGDDPITKARNAVVNQVAMDAYKGGGAVLVDEASRLAGGDVAAFVSLLQPTAALQQQADTAVAKFTILKNDKERGDMESRPIITAASSGLNEALFVSVRGKLKAIRDIPPGADRTREINDLINSTKVYLQQMSGNYDAVMLARLKEMHPEHPDLPLQLLDRDTWAAERDAYVANVNNILKIFDMGGLAKDEEAALAYFGSMKQADFFTRSPLAYNVASVFGSVAWGYVLQNSLVGTEVSKETSNIIMGAGAFGQKGPGVDAAGAVFEVFGDPNVDTVSLLNTKDGKFLEGLDTGIVSMWKAYERGTDKPQQEADAYKKAFDVYDYGLGAAKDGSQRRPTLEKNNLMFDALTADGVLKNASPDGRKYLVAKMDNEALRQRTKIFAWYQDGSYAKEYTRDKTVYINGQPQPLNEVLVVKGATPNPALFEMGNGGNTVRVRQLEVPPKPASAASDPTALRVWEERKVQQAEALDGLRKWAAVYNSQIPWVSKLKARADKYRN